MNIEKNSIVTDKECEHIIRRHLQSDDFQVLGYKMQQFSDTLSGNLGDHLLLKIKFCTQGADKEVSFFVKKVAFQHELQTRYVLALKAFTKEIMAYEVLFENFKGIKGFLPDFSPKYYFGKDNDIVVLEDLSARGFIVAQNLSSLSINHIELTLKVLAQYHAGSISYQETKFVELGKKYRLIDEYSDCLQESLYRKDDNYLGYNIVKGRLSALKAIIDLSPIAEDIGKETFKKQLDNLAERSFEIIKPNETFYNTVCHGDIKGKNVMFRYENGQPVECKLIDFQLQRYCPPAQDVLQFIYLTTNAETRRQYLHKLLRYYHEQLREELQNVNLDLENIITYEDFEQSVHYLLPQIKLQTAFYCIFQDVHIDLLKKISSNMDDLSKIMLEDSTHFSVELFMTDDNLKKVITDVLTDIKDFITHPKITLEDCFKIIESKLGTTNYQLLSHCLFPLEKAYEYLGDHYKLTINVCADNRRYNLQFFAKCIPENKIRLDITMDGRAFDKEHFFFKKLIPLIQSLDIGDIEKCVIPCHLLRLNDVLILDDIEYLQFYSANPRVPLDVDHLQVVIEKLAIYHACNIILEERMGEKMSEAFRLGIHFSRKLEERFFSINNHNPCSLYIKVGIEAVDYLIDLFSDSYSQLSQRDFKKKTKVAFKTMYELIKPSEKYRNVICHGDLWARNIMIKHINGKPADCRIIHYQLLRYCPPAHDLLCLLYLTTNRKIRADSMEQLIDFYYEILTNVLNKYGCDADKIYPKQHFMESCKYMIPQAVCQPVLYYQLVMANSNLMAEYLADEESTRNMLFENRSHFIYHMCQKDVIYREKLKESIQDLQEMCLKYY